MVPVTDAAPSHTFGLYCYVVEAEYRTISRDIDFIMLIPPANGKEQHPPRTWSHFRPVVKARECYRVKAPKCGQNGSSVGLGPQRMMTCTRRVVRSRNRLVSGSSRRRAAPRELLVLAAANFRSWSISLSCVNSQRFTYYSFTRKLASRQKRRNSTVAQTRQSARGCRALCPALLDLCGQAVVSSAKS